MMDQAPAWFGKVAPDLHIDTVYSKTLRQAGHSKASKRRAIIHLRRVCCMDAFKKQIPAKVNLWENSQFGNCPLCHEVVYRPALRKRVYCCKCGQALNWED